MHSPYLEGVTGSTEPCAWAAWLAVPANCAAAAYALTGPTPTAATLADVWTAFTDGAWTSHIGQAQAAVAE